MFLFIIFFIFAFDQVTKYIVLNYVNVPLKVTSFLNIVHVHNRGMIFGLFHDYPWIIFIIVPVIIIFILEKLRKSKSNLEKWAYGFVLGGAFSNFFDRFYYGHVIDFIDFHIRNFHWWVFNIADSAIVFGVMLLLWHQLKQTRSS